MKVYIKVHTLQKFEKIEKIDSSNFEVYTKLSPIKNKANKDIIKIFSKYFNVPKSNISFISGMTSKYKILDIDNDLL